MKGAALVEEFAVTFDAEGHRPGAVRCISFLATASSPRSRVAYVIPMRALRVGGQEVSWGWNTWSRVVGRVVVSAF